MIHPDISPVYKQSDVTIRPATFEDIEAMALVTQRANDLRDGMLLSAQANEDVTLNIEERLGKTGLWMYAGIGLDKMAGFVLGYPSSEEETLDTDPSLEYLALLMVEPDYWGHGIASILLDAVANSVRSSGKQEMVLWTSETNDRARRVYEHKGYVLTSQTRVIDQRGPQVQYLLSL